jgi:hypothetical protein
MLNAIMLNAIMLDAIMLNAIMLNVVMLSVMAPCKRPPVFVNFHDKAFKVVTYYGP